MIVALHGALSEDERYQTSVDKGGDARAEMILRYGTPSYAFWGGPAADVDHTGYLASPSHGPSPDASPYTTYEYTTGRLHLVPSWHAIANPFQARNRDWMLSGEGMTLDADLGFRPWWPVEHMALPYPLVQLPDGQTALLRREHDVLLATAVDLDPDSVKRAQGVPVDSAWLVVSDQPDSVRILAESPATVGGTLVLRAPIDPHPTIVGVEYKSPDEFHPAGRARFGITPPPALSAMKPGDRAISDPVLLRTGSGAEELPNETGAALDRMAGSTHVDSGGRLGVYWETYGFKPTDSVDVGVWIERYTSRGILRRLGNAFSITTDLNTPVAITWSEPRPDHSARIIDGPVPIVTRSVVVDVSHLPKGDYWLDVAVGKPGQEPLKGRRSFTIR